MKITTELLESQQLSLTIDVDEEQTQQAMRQAARRIANEVNIPGFRKGKAPYDLIRQRYGDDTLRQEAANSLAEEVYREALEQEGIEPYAPGALEEVGQDPISFTFTVPLRPAVDLGDYGSYRLEPPEVEVSEEELKQALEDVREQNAVLDPVDRPAALGGGVVVDLVGRAPDASEFLREDDVSILLDAESSRPAAGFAKAVVGMEAGEERTFTLTLPADFPQEELRGEDAEFTAKMGMVYEAILPELNDDLARTAGSFDSFEELEQHVRSQLLEAAEEKAAAEYADQVLADVIEQAEIAYPPVLLEKELDQTVEDFERLVKRQTHLTLEDYVRIQGKTMDEQREELEPRAAASLERALILGEVVRSEGLEVGEEEINTEIDRVSEPWGEIADKLRESLATAKGQQEIRSRLLANKAVHRLVAIARGEDPEPASAEEPQEPEAQDDQTWEAGVES